MKDRKENCIVRFRRKEGWMETARAKEKLVETQGWCLRGKRESERRRQAGGVKEAEREEEKNAGRGRERGSVAVNGRECQGCALTFITVMVRRRRVNLCHIAPTSLTSLHDFTSQGIQDKHGGAAHANCTSVYHHPCVH